MRSGSIWTEQPRPPRGLPNCGLELVHSVAHKMDRGVRVVVAESPEAWVQQISCSCSGVCGFAKVCVHPSDQYDMRWPINTRPPTTRKHRHSVVFPGNVVFVVRFATNIAFRYKSAAVTFTPEFQSTNWRALRNTEEDVHARPTERSELRGNPLP